MLSVMDWEYLNKKELQGLPCGPVVRLSTPNAGGPGSIPGQGTRSRMHAATKKLTCHN